MLTYLSYRREGPGTGVTDCNTSLTSGTCFERFLLGFPRPNFSFLFGDVVHGLGEVADVGGGDSCDGDAAVLGEVDAVVLDDLLDLYEIVNLIS